MHAWAWRAAAAAPRARDGLREEVAMPAASARRRSGDSDTGEAAAASEAEK